MKPKALGLAAVAAMAFTAVVASSASATTLEIGGVTQNGAVAISASLKSGTSVTLSRTDGSLSNTCTASSMSGTTNVFTGPTVTAPLSSLSFTSCERTVTVNNAGTLHIGSKGGTDGEVASTNGEWTVSSPFGTLTCKTGEGVNLGTLSGTASGHAEMVISGVLNCGFLVPSAVWKGTYVITSPTGLGVSG